MADLKIGYDTSEERAAPTKWGGLGAEIGGPFDGLRTSENCYNRAQMAGCGRSEVIWREWNRLRRNGRGYP